MVDAAGVGSTGFFRMVDDSSDDERFKARLLTEYNEEDIFEVDLVRELTSD
jgi:hypothetical protein